MKVLFWMFSGFDQHITSEHLLTAIIEQLCKAGHSVHILQKNTGGSLPPIPDKLACYSVTTDAIPVGTVDKGNFAARYWNELKYIKACKKYISNGYDAVFVQSNNVAGFALNAIRKKLPNTSVTYNVQDIFPYNLLYSGALKESSLVFKILSTEQRSGYRKSDRIITISEDMKETLVADGVEAKKIEVIYNWSYQDEPYSAELLADYNLFKKEYFNVVYAGNIGLMQNVDILIEAARLLKGDHSVWFHIIGNGVYKDKLEAKSREYGIQNISFLPMQPPEMAPVIYSNADINVIPLVKNGYRTALPSKTATCLACLKPVIFVIGRESLFGQKIMNKVGCSVIDPDSSKDLCEAILEIKSNKKVQLPYTFFINECSKEKNSKRYADTIVSSLQ